MREEAADLFDAVFNRLGWRKATLAQWRTTPIVRTLDEDDYSFLELDQDAYDTLCVLGRIFNRLKDYNVIWCWNEDSQFWFKPVSGKDHPIYGR